MNEEKKDRSANDTINRKWKMKFKFKLEQVHLEQLSIIYLSAFGTLIRLKSVTEMTKFEKFMLSPLKIKKSCCPLTRLEMTNKFKFEKQQK